MFKSLRITKKDPQETMNKNSKALKTQPNLKINPNKKKTSNNNNKPKVHLMAEYLQVLLQRESQVKKESISLKLDKGLDLKVVF